MRGEDVARGRSGRVEGLGESGGRGATEGRGSAAGSGSPGGPGPGAARRPIVGVMGSGSSEHADLAEPLGRWLAARGTHLLTGGGGGVMRSASRAFRAVEPREGVVLGILPGRAGPEGYAAFEGYPNEFVEIAIRTHLDRTGSEGTHELSRNHLNVLTADVVVALPGGAGTASEVELAVRYGKPVVLWLGERGAIEGLRPDLAARLPAARTFEDLERLLRPLIR